MTQTSLVYDSIFLNEADYDFFSSLPNREKLLFLFDLCLEVENPEDINNDESSIYLTSTQQIPIKASSTNYTSYKTQPDNPNQYSDKQIILNSGRLILNSTNDHILLTSNKTINLNAVFSINIDSPTTIIQSKSVLLGGKNATESILLGDTTINLLVGLVDQLTALTQALTTVMPDAGPAVSPAAIQLISYLTQLKLQLRNTTLSKISKTL
jgi:hypothetical protein